MSDGSNGLYEFGDFRLDIGEKELRRASGEVLTIPPKAFELLVFFVENPGRLLEKNLLMDQVWADSFVEEGNLKIHVHTLRRALNGSGREFIETVPRRGYRFNAEVRNASNDLTVEKITRSKLVIEETSDDEPAALALGSGRRRGTVLIVLLCGLAVAVFAYFFIIPQARKGAVSAEVESAPTIAVLPFRNLTADQRDDFLSIGLSDALTTRLGSISRLAVRPSSSVLRFTSAPGDAGSKLRVENVVEGTIQRIGDHLRISVQLVAIKDQRILWARNFDEDGLDLLKIQDSIVSNIADSLITKLSPSEQSLLAKSGTSDREAYELYLKGRFFWNKRSVDDLKRSVEYFDQARQKDPRYSLAYVGLADSYQLLGEYGGMNEAEAVGKAREAAKQALALNEDSAEAHASLAYMLAFYDWNWPEAGKEFKRSIELNPNYSTARQWYGEYLTSFGKFDEAMAETRKAEQLDPTSPIIQSDIAALYYLTRQYDRSIEQTNRVLELEPDFGYAYAYQWIDQEQSGRIEAAFDALIKLDSLILPAQLVGQERQAFASGGWSGLWKWKYEARDMPGSEKLWSNYVKAMAALRVGETDQAIKYLERSCELRERWFINLRSDPQWDPIRNDPRFIDLEQRSGL